MSAQNKFVGAFGGPTMSTGVLFAITPDDDDELEYTTRSLYVGTGGDVAVTDMRNVDTIIPDVPSGSTLFIRVKKVLDTDTTASGLVGGA